MRLMRIIAAAAILFAAAPALAADEVIEAIDQARKAYQGGDLAAAKQSLDLASQLIGQKNADAFGKLLPGPLAGWKAEEVQTTSIGNVGFGASTATRSYTNAKGDSVEVQITGDSAVVMQFATVLSNPAIAGAMGKLVRVGCGAVGQLVARCHRLRTVDIELRLPVGMAREQRGMLCGVAQHHQRLFARLEREHGMAGRVARRIHRLDARRDLFAGPVMRHVLGDVG